MAYIPTAKDFDDAIGGGYTPTAADFDQAIGTSPQSIAPGLLDRLRNATQSAMMSVAKETAKSPMLSKALQGAGSKADAFNKVVQATQAPALARGALQGAGSTLSSAVNLPIEAVNMLGANIPTTSMPDLSQYALPSEQGAGGTFASTLGQILGGSVVPLGAYSKIKGALPEMQGLLKYVPSMTAGAGSGFLTGENAPGGRTLSAVIGGGLSPVAEGVPATLKSFQKAAKIDSNLEQSQGVLENMAKSRSDLEAKIQLSNVLKNAKEQTRQNFNQQYQDLKNGPIGQTSIVNPLTNDELSLFKTGSLSNDTKNLLSQATDNPTAADYMLLSKQLRDEAGDMRGKASMDDLTQAQKEGLMNRADEVDSLRNEVKSRMNDSLSDDDVAKMQKLDSDYKDQYIPFKSDSAIRRAVSGRVGQGSFFNKINEPQNAGWQQYMSQAPWAKDYQNALTNFELKNLDLKQLPALTQLSRSDLMSAINPKARGAITNHIANLQTKQDVNDASNIINSFKKNIIPTLGAMAGIYGGSKAAHEFLGGEQ